MTTEPVTTVSARDRAIESLRRLPDDATMEDVLYRAYVLTQIDAGLADLEAGRVYTTEEVGASLGL